MLEELKAAVEQHEGKFFILDTETTGLHDGEICQIAIIDETRKVWFNNFVKTKDSIPGDATLIHGITDAMVAEAPTWYDIAETIQNFLKGHLVIIYNAVYDRKMMHKSAERWDMPRYDWKEYSTFICAMEVFAEYCGDWSDYHQSYKWKTLSFATTYCGYSVLDAHHALGDCQMTLTVVNHMLGKEQPQNNDAINLSDLFIGD